MLATRSTNYQPVMLNFVRPEAVKSKDCNDLPILHYDYRKQITIYMGGGGGGGNRPQRRTLPNTRGTISPLSHDRTTIYDTTYGD